MLGDHGISQRSATRRHPEAPLQQRERQGLALLCLLQEGEHQLNGRHPQATYSASTIKRAAPSRSPPASRSCQKSHQRWSGKRWRW